MLIIDIRRTSFHINIFVVLNVTNAPVQIATDLEAVSAGKYPIDWQNEAHFSIHSRYSFQVSFCNFFLWPLLI